MKFTKLSSAASIVTIGLLGIAAPAMAQDVSWAGPYVGGNAGVTWGDSSSDPMISVNGVPPVNVVNPIPPADLAAFNASLKQKSPHHTGFQGGIEAGYNWEFHGGFVAGLETDFGVFDITGSNTRTYVSQLPVINPPGTPTTYTASQKADTDWLWTLRPRVGYASGPMLFYATGGLAMTRLKFDGVYSNSGGVTTPESFNISKRKTDTGWTVGAGGAYKFNQNLSFKAEYLYLDFGHEGQSYTTSDGYVTLASDVGLKAHVVRAGLDYSF